MISLYLMLAFLILMFLGMPVAFAIGVSFIFFFILSDVPIQIGPQRIISMTQSFPLLAVPLFILAGHLMNHSGITENLIKLSRTLTGWITGGLAHVAIMLSALMGGVSGSAVADAAMEARILGPAMLERGLSKGYSCAVISVGSLITATIPPSIGLILYGYLGNVSIGRLFAAGIMPGILMTIFLMATAYVIARRRGYQAEDSQPPTAREVALSAWNCKWALCFPVFLLVGIRYGIFTPSEAGAFAILYAVLVGFFVYRQLTFKKLYEALNHSVTDVAMIMLIIMFSSMVNYSIAMDQLPQLAATFLLEVTNNKIVLMTLIITLIVLLGMVMETAVITLLLTPILVPIVTRLGIDPVHFGVIMMTCTTLGCMTPPVGTAMFVVCGIMKCSIEEYMREVVPFILTIVAIAMLMIFWPQLVLFMPDLIFGVAT